MGAAVRSTRRTSARVDPGSRRGFFVSDTGGREEPNVLCLRGTMRTDLKSHPPPRPFHCGGAALLSPITVRGGPLSLPPESTAPPSTVDSLSLEFRWTSLTTDFPARG